MHSWAPQVALDRRRAASQVVRSNLERAAAVDVVRLDTQMRSVLQSVRDEDLQLAPEAEPNLRFVDSDEAKRALDGAVQGWGHVTNSATCAALCTATFDRGLVAGEEVVVTVRAMDAQGRPRTDGGDRVRVVLSSSAAASAASASSATSVAAEAKDAHDGSYEARVTAGADWDGGAGALAVTINGRHVRESPFGVHISSALALRLTPASQILDPTMAATLARICSPMGGALRQLLATTASTNDKSSFDAAVKGIGRVIVLIRTTAGHVFGSYVHRTFGEGDWDVDDGAFLFALGNLTHAPVKLKAAPRGGKVYLGNCGLHVGQGGDFVTFCNTNTCGMPKQFTLFQDFEGCQAAPVSLSAGYLCGTPGTAAFTPSRMEVYTFS